jgi:hypothetical protein
LTVTLDRPESLCVVVYICIHQVFKLNWLQEKLARQVKTWCYLQCRGKDRTPSTPRRPRSAIHRPVRFFIPHSTAPLRRAGKPVLPPSAVRGLPQSLDKRQIDDIIIKKLIQILSGGDL